MDFIAGYSSAFQCFFLHFFCVHLWKRNPINSNFIGIKPKPNQTRPKFRSSFEFVEIFSILSKFKLLTNENRSWFPWNTAVAAATAAAASFVEFIFLVDFVFFFFFVSLHHFNSSSYSELARRTRSRSLRLPLSPSLILSLSQYPQIPYYLYIGLSVCVWRMHGGHIGICMALVCVRACLRTCVHVFVCVCILHSRSSLSRIFRSLVCRFYATHYTRARFIWS